MPRLCEFYLGICLTTEEKKTWKISGSGNCNFQSYLAALSDLNNSERDRPRLHHRDVPRIFLRDTPEQAFNLPSHLQKAKEHGPQRWGSFWRVQRERRKYRPPYRDWGNTTDKSWESNTWRINTKHETAIAMFSTKDGTVISLRAVDKDQHYVQVDICSRHMAFKPHTHTSVTNSRIGKFVTVHFTTACFGMEAQLQSLPDSTSDEGEC